MGWLILFIILFIALLFLINRSLVRSETIYEYERGVRFREGKITGVLEPGKYWICPMITGIERVDVRERFTTIKGQEILTSDGVTIKVTIIGRFSVEDPRLALTKVDDYDSALYSVLQLALRKIVGGMASEQLLSDRTAIDKHMFEASVPEVEALGLKLISVNVKDIMFPGDLKQIFAQVTRAKKEAQASLEKARGETAVMRKMANNAEMLKKHPGILQLRLMSAMEKSYGNTFIVGLSPDGKLIPIPKK